MDKGMKFTAIARSGAPAAARLAAALTVASAIVLVALLPGWAEGKKGPRKLIASDTAGRSSPIPVWGSIGCQAPSRHRRPTSGGDPRLTAMGRPQGNRAFRRMTVLDGDWHWGERCELGMNNLRGPVTFYREGRRRITYLSIRLPGNFPLHTHLWQGVMQMKQAGPADNQGGPPVLLLTAYRGRWQLWHSPPGKTFKQNLLWSRRARQGAWIRFAFDVFYSRKPSRGRITVKVDLNGDRDFRDPGERSRRFRTNTLKRETAGTVPDRKRKGTSLPSHLRVGIYHDPAISCPRPRGCSVDIDNVQVVRP